MGRRAWIHAVAVVIALVGAVGLSAPASGGPVRPPVFENPVGAAWGRNSSGELGDLSWANRTSPVDIYQLTGVEQIAAGHHHSLAVMIDGSLRTWGGNGYGQLGYGVWVPSFAPKAVPGLTSVVGAAGGESHSLAVKADGTVWAWGDNASGQVGDGTMTRRYSPVQVPGLTGAVAVAAGRGWSLALRSDGSVWAWGSGGTGILGTAGGTRSLTPVMVEGLRDVVAITAGAGHALAITLDGTGARVVFAWGDNSSFQLAAPRCPEFTCPTPVPWRVLGLPSIAGVAAGWFASMALGTDGSLWAWGSVIPGSPTGLAGIAARPALAAPAGSGMTGIAVGFSHVVATRRDGMAIGWGSSTFGQVGNGGTAPENSVGEVRNLTRVRQVAAGLDHSLAIYGKAPVIQP